MIREQNWLQNHSTVINQEVITILIMECDPSQLKNAQDQAKYKTQTSLPRIISFKVFTFGLALPRNMIRISFCILFLNIF